MPAANVKLDPFIESKVRLWYRLHNKKRNGFIGAKDCAEMADCFSAQFQLSESMAREVRSWLVDGWSTMVELGTSVENGVAPLISADTTPHTLLVVEKMAHDGVITEDMYVHAFGEILAVNETLFSTCFSQMVALFFDVFDTDRDGYITADDMVKGLACFGIMDEAAVRAVFQELDAQGGGGGKVAKETYVAAWLEYMVGKDREAPMAKHFTPEML